MSWRGDLVPKVEDRIIAEYMFPGLKASESKIYMEEVQLKPVDTFPEPKED